MLGGLLQAKTKKPNIVLILFDDLGWKDFACYGNSTHSTPNIDALAKEGVKFNQAYAACPVCSPSRAALLTGKYPPRSGVTDWIPGRAQWPTAKLLTPRTQTQLALEEQTLAERLNRAVQLRIAGSSDQRAFILARRRPAATPSAANAPTRRGSEAGSGTGVVVTASRSNRPDRT